MNEKVYTIKEVATILDIEAYVLRYYEKELELQIHRNSQGHRIYTQKDITILQQIKELREQGLELKGIRNVIHTLDQEGLESLTQVSATNAKVIPLVGEDIDIGDKDDQKVKQFTMIIKEMLKQTLVEYGEENKRQLHEELTQEMDIMMDKKLSELEVSQQQKNEEYYKKMDETMREMQKMRKEIALLEQNTQKPSLWKKLFKDKNKTEEIEEKKTKKEVFIIDKSSSQPVSINSIVAVKEERFTTDIEELDRVLGGGIVKGSLVLVGGDPGIGKSTLLMQVSSKVANTNKKVLYISGEESESQIKMRASRLGVNSQNLYIFAENNLSIIEAHLEKINPELIIVDSIQTVYSPEISSAPGTVSQIKEGTSKFMKISKKMGISTFIVGHVTKEGALAGPKLLEHMVDTVLYFEGERYNSYRLVRAVKNRFGSTNELGVFEMKDVGLVELTNPSQVLISEKPKDVSGSVIISTVEGTRPMLLELQALVAPTNFGMARRTSTGVDFNRVALLLAVLEKRIGLQIQNQDVYINVVGGIKINEPSIDLGIVIAVASSFRNIPIAYDVVVTGEVGLTGEIRAVSYIEKRIAECKKLGFKKIVIPRNNYEAVKDVKGIEIIPVDNLRQAINIVLRG